MTPRGRSGLTLVNLLLSLGIVGLLGLVAVPKARAFSQAQTSARASRLLALDLERAFALAGRVRAPVVLACRCTDRVLQVRRGGQILVERRFDETSGLPLTALAFAPDSIVVQPSGVGSAILQVTASAGAASTRIQLSTSGLAEVLP